MPVHFSPTVELRTGTSTAGEHHDAKTNVSFPVASSFHCLELVTMDLDTVLYRISSTSTVHTYASDHTQRYVNDCPYGGSIDGTHAQDKPNTTEEHDLIPEHDLTTTRHHDRDCTDTNASLLMWEVSITNQGLHPRCTGVAEATRPFPPAR